MAQRRPTADSSQVPMKGFWNDPLTGFRRSETTGDNAAAGPGCLKLSLIALTGSHDAQNQKDIGAHRFFRGVRRSANVCFVVGEGDQSLIGSFTRHRKNR